MCRGTGEFHGQWGDHSENWSDELRSQFGSDTEDDGTFWVSFEEFRSYFDGMWACYVRDSRLASVEKADTNIPFGKAGYRQGHCLSVSMASC
jgi:hypothetical protein